MQGGQYIKLNCCNTKHFNNINIYDERFYMFLGQINSGHPSIFRRLTLL
jgi:hypothetical protein